MVSIHPAVYITQCYVVCKPSIFPVILTPSFVPSASSTSWTCLLTILGTTFKKADNISTTCPSRCFAGVSEGGLQRHLVLGLEFKSIFEGIILSSLHLAMR